MHRIREAAHRGGVDQPLLQRRQRHDGAARHHFLALALEDLLQDVLHG